VECLFILMTFGIPKDLLPFMSDGTPHLAAISDWLSMRMKEEETTPLSNRVVVPSKHDILLGRGKRVQESPGNFSFRHILDTYRDEYERVSKFEKTVVAESILRLIKDSGGRFLKQGDCGWTQVEDEMARKKISHAFRNLRSTPSSMNGRTSSSVKRGTETRMKALIPSSFDESPIINVSSSSEGKRFRF
jgi:hypothetical protein